MIKKILAFISCLFVFLTPAYSLQNAEFVLEDTGAIQAVLETYFPGDVGTQMKVLQHYIDDTEQGQTANIKTMAKMCRAAGYVAKKDCKQFASDLLWAASGYYESSCQSGNATTSICDTTFQKYKVLAASAKAIVQEYTRVRLNDAFMCDTEYRTERRSAYIRCKSGRRPLFYEFKFKSLDVGDAEENASNVKSAIFQIYRQTFGQEMEKGMCELMTPTAKRFGYKPVPTNVINVNPIKRAPDGMEYCELKPITGYGSDKPMTTMCGIDNFAFCKDIETTLDMNTHEQLVKYVAQQCNTDVGNIACTYGTGVYYGKKCNPAINNYYDDIVSCFYNGAKVDLVVDDLAESGNNKVKAGKQAMSCIITGGTYSGKRCIGLGEQQCNVLRQSNLQECPECKAVKWDEETQSCILPSSADAQKMKKGLNIALIIGGAVVGVVITVATVGTVTAAAAGTAAATKAAIAFTAIETVGAGIELDAQLQINAIADDFLVESNKCKNATCAKEMLSQNLQRMANYANDMTAAEADAVDSEMARLANLIPDDDEIWATMLVNGTDMADNKLGFFDIDSWEPEQVWRAVGIGLQLASLITGITKWVISKSSRVVKSTAAIKQKFARAIQSIDNAPESTLHAKRLELKQLTKNGKKVSNADAAADAAKARKIANADSPESEAGFAAMMKRVDESNARNITPEDIEAEFISRQAAEGGKYTEADIAERMQNYNDYRAAHGNGTLDTRTKYTTPDGSYTAERQQIHDQILDDLFKDADKAKPAAGEQPTFVMLGGRGGSGKSSLKGLAYDPDKTVVIDADKIKTMLPEYSELFEQQSKYAGLNAWEVHEESSDIVKEALAIAKERGINVVLDGTMSSAGSALKKITPFEDAGYRIEGAYMFLPREESTVRGMGRGIDIDYSDVESGRFVPTDVLLDMRDNEKAFAEVSEHFDSWGIWTTEGVKKGELPNLIGHSEDIGVFERGDDFQTLNNTDIDLTTFGKE